MTRQDPNLQFSMVSADIEQPKIYPSTPADFVRKFLRRLHGNTAPWHHGRPMIRYEVVDHFRDRTSFSYRCRHEGCKTVRF